MTAESDLSRRPGSLAVRREADETVWRHTATGTEYVEFASGLNYQTIEGEWRPSREEIVLLPDGSAGAVHGQHKVIFAPNLNSAGAVHFLSRDGRPFRSHPLGLYYFCATTGRSALIARVQDSIGELLPPNQIVYRETFEGVQADVCFTYTKAGFESDVIVRKLPGPEAFGLDPESARLEVWWAFVGAPEPDRQVRVLKTAEGDRESMVEPDLIDETLDFGDLWFPQGRAFSAEGAATERTGETARIELPEASDEGTSIRVGKQWLEIDGQRVLVESVDWLDAAAHLERESSSATFAGSNPRNRVSPRRVLDIDVAQRNPVESIRLADGTYRESGLVIDYISVNPNGSYTFQTGQTYYISSSGYMNGTAAFQPGCIIKFANNAYLLMYGWTSCQGTSSNPSILTSKDDDLFGETIAGSTGNPGPMASPALWDYYTSSGLPFSGMKVRWAKTAFKFDASSGSSSDNRRVTDSILQQCQNGVVAGPTASVYVNGLLMCNVTSPFSGSVWSDSNPYGYPTYSADPMCATDGDSDGLPDSWEITHFGNTTAQTATMDADGDGLTNLDEYQLGLNPKSTDTDYDGRSDAEEVLEGTNPLDHASYTPVRLGYWRFNSPSWLGEQGQVPMAAQSLSAESSWSGTAVKIDSPTAGMLKYRVVETGGAANLNLRRGTVRFWIKPRYNSGQHIGSWGRMVNVGAYTGDASHGHWCLRFDPYMQQIAFTASSNGVNVAYFNYAGPLNWTANDWHQVVLTYSPQQSQLYLDGQLVKTGTGVTRWPTDEVQAEDGLALGSNRAGTEQPKGHFEELEIFNYPLDASQIQADYLAMLEPHSFELTIPSRNVNYVQVPATIEGGAAGMMAVLINSENFASAAWTPFLPSFTLDLGAGDGVREVWVGLKGVTGVPYWRMKRIVVDTVPPTVTIDDPSSTSFTTSQPIIQIKGHFPEASSGIRYDVSNAGGNVTDLQGFTVDQDFDSVSHELTHNWFQCFDVELAEGQNTITLRATDLAGNTSTKTLNAAFDLSGDSTPPQITIHWPNSGMSLAGTAFTMRGQLNDPTATVSVAGLTETPIEGIVERNGLFWVEDLPLVSGNNTLTFTATDAAGNHASQNFTVVGSGLEIVIDEIPTEDYADSKLTVIGTINSGEYAVWVNGVRAYDPVLQGSTYEWYAENVPLLDLGTAIIEVRAIPYADNDGNGDDNAAPPTLQNMGNPTGDGTQDFLSQTDREPWVTVESFTTWREWHMPGPFDRDLDLTWRDGETSTRVERIVVPPSLHGPHGYTRTETTTWPEDHWVPSLTGSKVTVWDDGTPSPQTTPDIPAPKFHWEHCSVADPQPVTQSSEWDTYKRQASGVVKLHTGGKAKTKDKDYSRPSLFSFTAPVSKVHNPRWDPESGLPHGGTQIPYTTLIRIGDVGVLGSDGYLFKALPDDDTVLITPSTDADFYVYSVSPQKHKLRITANGAELLSEALGDDAKFCVGQEVELQYSFDRTVPTIEQAQITTKWVLDGDYVNDQPILYPVDGSQNYYRNSELLWLPITSAWWINGAFEYEPLRQQLGLTIAFANGQTVPVTTAGIMGMHRPNLEVKPIRQSNGMYQWFSNAGTALEDDSLWNTSDSRQFWMTIHSRHEGKANWTQLCLLEEYTDFFGLCRTTDGEFWLDNARFYNPSSEDVMADVPCELRFSDSPSSFSGWQAIVVDDHFKAFAMFTPTGGSPPNIWVPLGRVDWIWEASALKQAGVWNIDLDNCPPPTFEQQCWFPEWEYTYTNPIPD